MSSGDEKTVDVVLVTYQSADDLPSFLDSVTEAVAPLTVNMIGIDNTSTDNSAEQVEKFGGLAVRNSTNIGLSAAINQGAALGTADWILVANPDTQLSAGAVSALIDTARADETIGMIGPRIIQLDGKPYPSGRRFPSIGMGIAHALLAPLWKNNPATRAYFGNPSDTEVSDVDWISGCCMLFRRSAFQSVDGFDARYFLYFEETKMALDLHRAGWRVVLDPQVSIRHREGGSMRHAPMRKVRSHHRSALRFYADYNKGRPWIVLTPFVAAGLIARGLVAGARAILQQVIRRKP